MTSGLSEFLITGLLLALALICGRTASACGLPRVAAYLLVGILFSPQVLGAHLGLYLGAWRDSFTTGALGMIAYLIGGSITVDQLHRMGSIITACTLGECFGAMLAVFCCVFGLFLLQAEPGGLQLAMALGVLAVSTDAVSTLAVIHQYRAQGPMTNTLLGMVALDDAVGIICFSILAALLSGGSLGDSAITALREIGGAILLGAAAGWLLCRSGRLFGESGLRLPLVLSAILLILGTAENLHFSPLLSAMSLGFFTRLYSRASAQRLFNPVYALEETLFILFFALAGLAFDPGVFTQYLALIGVYVAARVLGKIIGVSLAAKLAGAPPALVHWLGLGLLPQAGVAVGLALILSHQPVFAQAREMIVNVIVGTTLLHEICGPMAVQFALRRAGEIHTRREKHHHEGF